MKYYVQIITIIQIIFFLKIPKTTSKNVSENDASGFIDITELIPEILLDIRYYSNFNFVGERIPGYKEPIALMTKEAGNALKKVSEYLREKGYLIKIFDAYRPQKAVDYFVSWAKNNDTKMKKYFYPNISKNEIVPKGYVASKSDHAKGSTIDLTLFNMNESKDIDMGGTFDFFGEISHPDYINITNQQKKNREFLIDSMRKFGFEVISTEWWHFYLKNQPFNNTFFNFDVSKDSIKEKENSWKIFIYFCVFICGFFFGLGIFCFFCKHKTNNESLSEKII